MGAKFMNFGATISSTTIRDLFITWCGLCVPGKVVACSLQRIIHGSVGCLLSEVQCNVCFSSFWNTLGHSRTQNFLYFPRISLEAQRLGSIFCNRKTCFLWETLEEALYSKHYQGKIYFQSWQSCKTKHRKNGTVCGKAEQANLPFFFLQFANVESSKQLTVHCFLLWNGQS